MRKSLSVVYHTGDLGPEQEPEEFENPGVTVDITETHVNTNDVFLPEPEVLSQSSEETAYQKKREKRLENFKTERESCCRNSILNNLHRGQCEVNAIHIVMNI